MSSIEKISANQLFTELTDEEGALVAGGATVQLRYLFPKNPIQNDPRIMVGRNTAYAKDNVTTTQTIFKNVSFSGDTTLSIWDYDPGSNNDDLLGYHKLSGAAKGVTFLNAEGYDLSYRVF